MRLLRLFIALALGILFAIANAQTIHQVAEGDSTLEAAFRDAAGGDIIELITDGGLYTNSKLFVNKDITIRAAAGLEIKPILQNIDSITFNYLFKINGMATLVLEGLDLDGDGTGNGAENILFNIIAIDTDDSLSAVQLKIDNCLLHDVSDKLIKPYGQSGIDSLLFRNTTFYNAAKEGVVLYSGSSSDPPVYLDYAEFYNCTFYSTTREAIKTDTNPDTKVVINHCTFYDIGGTAIGSEKSFISVGQATDVLIKNSIFQKNLRVGNFIRLESDANVVKNCVIWDVNDKDIDNSNSVSDTLHADPLFADTANADFTLLAGSPAFNWADDGSSAGDLRWATNAPADAFFLTIDVIGSGTVTSVPDTSLFAPETKVVLTATPSVEGEIFRAWIGDLTGSSNPDSLIMDSHKNVTAIFGINEAPSSFTLLNPSDGNTLTSLTDPVNFEWNQSKDFDGDPIIYTLNISGGVGLDTTFTALTDTTFIFNGDGIFKSTSVYNWYVLAGDGEFTTSSADTFSFLTPNVASSLFTLLEPSDGDTLTSLTDPVNFIWNQSKDADGDPITYSLNILGGVDLDTTITDVTDTTFIFIGDGIFESSSVYNWHVLASDGEFTTSSADTFSFLTPNIASSSFTLLQPSDGDTLTSLMEPVNFIWNQSKDSDGDLIIYTLNISGGTDLDTTITALTDTLFIFDGDGIFESTSVYNWYVLASDGEFTTSSKDTFSFVTPTPTGIGDDFSGIPGEFALLQNYPNPFNPTTTIKYQLPQATQVKLEIFNILGQRLRILINRRQSAGYKTMTWDGKNSSGQTVPSGMYLYRIQTSEDSKIKKMILMK